MKKVIQLVADKDGILKAMLYDDGSIMQLQWDGQTYTTSTTGEKYPLFQWIETVKAPLKVAPNKIKK
jgi:hypothetical protein